MTESLKNLFTDPYRFVVLIVNFLLVVVFIRFNQINQILKLEFFSIIFLLVLFVLFYLNLKKEFSKLIVLLFSFPLFIFFIIEIFLGSWSIENQSKYKKFKNTTLTQKNIWYLSEDKLDDKISIYLNRYGLRGRLVNESLDNLDILFMGGSTTVQSTITDGKTFVGALQKKFKIKKNKDLYFLNGGEDAHDSKSHIDTLENRLREINIKPKFFLFFIGHNESINAHHFDRFYNIKNPLISKIYNSSFIFNKVLEVRIYLGTLILNPKRFHKWHLNGYLPLEKDLVDENYVEIEMDEKYENQMINDLEQELNNIEKNMKILSNIVIKEYEAIPIFMNHVKSTYWKNNENIYVFKKPIIDDTIINLSKYNNIKSNYYWPKIFAEKIYSTCQRIVSAICIDLFNDGNLSKNDFHDFAHFKPTGAEKIANLIFFKLKNEF